MTLSFLDSLFFCFVFKLLESLLWVWTLILHEGDTELQGGGGVAFSPLVLLNNLPPQNPALSTFFFFFL